MFEVGGKGGTGALEGLVSEAEMLREAIVAGEGGNGDTDEFKNYLRAIGIDPSSVHRGQYDGGPCLTTILLARWKVKSKRLIRLMTDQMEAIADETGLAMGEVERILNDFNIDPFMDYMEENVVAIVELANMTVGDLSQIFLPDFDASPAKRNERLETQTAQLGTILDVIEAGGTPNTSLVEDYIATNVDVNRNAGMDGATASLAAIQSFGLSLSHYAPEQAEAVMRAMGLNRDGVVMEDMLTRMFTDLGV